MSNSVTDFYDQLAADYHLIFADWQQSVLRQADTLDKIIRQEMRRWPLSILDCSCGIGTQAIGMALKGYTVHATDISPAAVQRTVQEAAHFGVHLSTGVADMQMLDSQVARTFDVVITMDNALPHLLDDESLEKAANAIAAKTRSDGLLVASIRDYDQLLLEKPRSTMPQLYESEDDKRVTFQIWDWQGDEPLYTLNHFILKQYNGQWETAHRATTYRALRRHELDDALSRAGFKLIHWLMPETSGYYQPIVLARMP